MQIRIIEDEAQFAQLEGPWQQLAMASGARPFQEFGWADAWMKTVGTTGGRRLHVATLWEGQRLLAVLPLVLRRYKGVRLLEWIGARFTDYCDALLDPQIDAREAVGRMWKEIERRGGFDVMRLGQVRTDSGINGFLDELHPWVETRESTIGVPLRCASGSEWLQQQGKETRRRINRYLRRMSEMGFQVRLWQPSESYAPLLEAAIEQKTAWIRAQNLSSVLIEPQGMQFIRRLAASMAASGALHLSAVCSSDQIAAVHLGFFRGGTLYSYLATYDAALAKCSFGSTLRDWLIMWACDNGARRFDMMLGAHEYKTQYDTTLEPLRTLVIPRGLVGRAAVAFYRRRQEARGEPPTAESSNPLSSNPEASVAGSD